MRKFMIAATFAAGLALPAGAATIYGVNEANELVTFNSATPGVFTSRVAISGLPDVLKGVDFRLADGALYGLTADYSLVKISKAGVATTIATGLALAGTEFGFDFNQSIDRIRIVSNTNQNYVINPNTGAIQLVATPVFYPGSPGTDPDVTAVSYTPSDFGGATQLYGIDTRQDTLVKQANNTGVLTTVGPIGVNFGSRDSFDIDRQGNAFAIDNGRFYRLNLNTGALSLVGNTDGTVYGISAAIPEPASWAMMIGGFGLVGGLQRRALRAGSATAA